MGTQGDSDRGRKFNESFSEGRVRDATKLNLGAETQIGSIQSTYVRRVG